MRPYHLLKLVEWAGNLNGRKRLQKVVFLLQAAGCKAFDDDFILHRFGPYSPEVAGLADQLVTGGWLAETEEPNQVMGKHFSYKVTDAAKKALAEMEQDERNVAVTTPLTPFERMARELLSKDIGDLEYGATIVYFQQRSKGWDKALTQACNFKALDPNGPAAQSALRLAKTIVT